MAFTVLPTTRDDLPTLVEIFHDAFADDPEFKLIYRNSNREDVLRFDLKGYEKAFETPGRRFFKAVDGEGGQIVAFSRWWFPYTLTPEQGAAGVGVDKLPDSWPPGTEVALVEDYFGKLFEARRRLLDHTVNYFVNILAVRPDYQRRGLGAMLLENGLALADKDGARTYIEASKRGLGLYLKYGWKEVEDLVIDTRPYGGEIEVTKCMIREPQSQ